MTLRRVLVATLVLVSACRCEKKPEPAAATSGPGMAGGQMRPPQDELPRELSPLPEPPPLSIAPEALPGAGGELAVVSSRPQGEVYGEVRPTVTFSKPVVALSTVEEQKKLAPPGRVEPALEGEWRWLGSASAEFVPKGLVPYATEFTVTINKGLKAIDGAELKEEHAFKFQTPRPQLQAHEPYEGFRWCKPRQSFTLLFNQPVRELEQHARFTSGDKKIALKITREVSLADEKREQEARAEPRRYERLSYEEKGVKDRRTRYLVEPAQDLPYDSDVQLVIDDKLASAEGPLTFAGQSIAFRTYGPFVLKEATACLQSDNCPYGPLVIRTSNRADVKGLKERLVITPDADVTWDRVEAHLPYEWNRDAEPYIVIPGRFRPGATYAVGVKAGLKDEFDQAAGELSGAIATDDLEPSVSVGADVALFESSGPAELPVEAVNFPKISVRAWRVTLADVARLLADYRRVPPSSGPKTFTLDAGAEKNRPKKLPLKVRDALSGRATGLTLLKIATPHGDASVVAQVTDLAVHAKVAPASGVVWVTSLSTGAPVGGAKVTLVDENGKQLWAGATGEDGLAAAPGLSSLGLDKDARDWFTPELVAGAEKGGDIGFTHTGWSGGASPYAFGIQTGWEGSMPDEAGLVFTERGVYRPGDTVYLKGVLRYRRVGEMRAPSAGSKVLVTITDPRGKELLKEEQKLTRFGSFSTRVETPKEGALGYHEVSVEGDVEGKTLRYRTSFRVEEYRAPQFMVDVSAPLQTLAAGDALKGSVLARYLFGGAMQGAKVRWSAHRQQLSFEPPGHEAWRFGQQTWWWDDNAPQPAGGLFAGGEGEIDAKGQLAIDAGKSETPGDWSYTYTIEAEVEDVNRQRIANRVAVAVHPAAHHLGLKLPVGFPKAKEEVPIELVAVTSEGKRAEGVKAAVEVVRRDWKSVRKEGTGGEWFTVQEPVETKAFSCEVVTAREPQACKFTPSDGGFYIVRATAPDAAGRIARSSTGLYVLGEGFISWQRDDTDRVDLLADKTTYAVGDTAHLLVKSPYPECEALLTVEREGVLRQERRHFKGSAVTLDVPVDESLVPNAFVGLLLFRPRVSESGARAAAGEPVSGEVGDDPLRPAVRVGYATLKVENKVKRLTVAVTPDAAEKRPGDEVTVNIRVTDHKGAGAEAEVAVFAVDEGVLRLTDYRTPDPLTAMYPPRPLSVRNGFNIMHLVRREKFGEKGEDPGGGGGEEASAEGSGFRSKFRTTVLFAPETATQADGTASVSFNLPDNLTTFRIMAVATAASGDKFGSGESKVVVSKPLLVLQALPRFARAGDRFEAGVVVHMKSGEARDVTVTAQSEGSVKLEGDAKQVVRVEPGRAREVRFPFVAQLNGLATFRFRAIAGADADGVEEKIGVELPVGMEAVAVYGDTKDKSTEGLVPPAGVRSDVGVLEMTLASTALGNFDEGMRQLVEYPYGCLEQLSSRLVPFVALRDIAGKFGIAWVGAKAQDREANARLDAFFREWMGSDYGGDPWDLSNEIDPDAAVRKTIRRIEALQAGDGGFRYWDDSVCTWPYASAYATMALWRAHEVGYVVSPGVLDHAKEYLVRVLGGYCPCPTWCGWSETTQALILYTLSRMKDPKPSYYQQALVSRNKLPLFGKALLADALFVGGGDRGQARSLMQEILNQAKESPAGVHFEEVDPQTYATLWSSDTRTTGVVLQTLTDITPDHPYVGKMARYLAGVRRGGRWRTTQEAAWSLIGLTELVRTKEKETPEFKAIVTLGEKELAAREFKGRSVKVEKVVLDIAQILAAPGGPSGTVPFVFAKDGPGVLYYGALLRYAPSEIPLTALDRGMFVQRWFEPYNGGGQATKFYAGDLVRVRVRVASNQERHFVVVNVPLPAGLEPVDTSLATTARQTQKPQEEAPGEGYEYESGEDMGEGGGESEAEGNDAWAWGWWSPFNHTEQRDDRVALFADHLPPGVHASSFVARATTPGKFLMKPAQAEEMYAPEVFGRSEGGTFEIILPPEVAQAP